MEPPEKESIDCRVGSKSKSVSAVYMCEERAQGEAL